MNDNSLSNVMSLIKKQKWENLFKRRELMHPAACKKFYANLTVFIYKKKDIARSRVKRVEIEFDSMKMASILDIPGHTGISECIKEIRGESTSGEKFYNAEDEIQEPAVGGEEIPKVVVQVSAQQKETEGAGVDPSGPSGHLPESVMNKLQAEFERAHADRIQADVEKAQAKITRLLALLQQAKNPPKP
ncbi:hypothetical protein Dimus_001051 [Dionaea muscipula]